MLQKQGEKELVVLGASRILKVALVVFHKDARMGNGFGAICQPDDDVPGTTSNV